MPNTKEMIEFAVANKSSVHRWQEAISQESVYPRIRAEVEATPALLIPIRAAANTSASIYTYGVLCAMGYGAAWAREIIMVQLAIDRLEG